MTASDDALVRQTLRVAGNADIAIFGQHDLDRAEMLAFRRIWPSR